MNIIEEYSRRNCIKQPVALHSYPSFLILKPNNSTLVSNHCVLHTIWDHGQPGRYKISLNYPKLGDESISSLSGNHFTLSKTWSEYESFFRDWNPTNFVPVFGQEVLLSSWEIFVFLKESWFAKQSRFLRDLLFDTIDHNLTFAERTVKLNKLLSTSAFCDMSLKWNQNFYHPIRDNYLHWLAGGGL